MAVLTLASPAAESIDPIPTNQTAPQELPAFLVTASRMPQASWQTAATVDELTEDFLTHAPSLALDDALRSSSAFSLFRRSNSTFANPTAQGVSLRGLGPSGASRSLVLLEGIPLNDPFGGWITWTKIPRLTLRHAEIVRGGGSSVWGNAALGGTVQLFAPAPEGTGGALLAEAGSFETFRTEMLAQFSPAENHDLQIGGRWFRTDGPLQYAPAQRGPIDRPFDSEHTLAHVTWATHLASGLRLSVGGRFFDEERGNGTPYQRNDSRENAVHARLNGELRPGFELDVLAYAQRQHFASRFSAVNEDRTAETPALDQFDVPASAWGGAVVAYLEQANDAATSFGADLRAVTGETREDFFFSDGDFSRRRFAGGDQWAGGVFVAHQRPLGGELTGHVAARVDRWENSDGHRREWVRATEEVLRDDSFADTSGTEFSPSAGIAWHPTRDWTWRASAYRAFRVPTLNELYRPFRVGNVATEANPALARETVTGAEVGVEFARGPWSGRAAVFHNTLHDGVANVTLSSTPTLTQRQRLNLDEIRVRGFEASLGWNPQETWSLFFDYMLTDARVREAALDPTLEGRRLAQVPRHVATLRLLWQPAPAWRIDAAVRAVSRQYEDDQNELPLDGATTVDLAVRRTVNESLELHVAAENIFNARVETGRSAAGLVSLAPDRSFRAGLLWRW